MFNRLKRFTRLAETSSSAKRAKFAKQMIYILKSNYTILLITKKIIKLSK